MTNPHLYEDLIYQILSRLPVKSLLRCKSVCKLWLSIISTSCFIKSHLSESTNNPRLISCHWMESPWLGMHITRPLNFLFNESKEERLNKIIKDSDGIAGYNKILKDGSVTVEINGVVGYCNGLVCLTCASRLGDLYFWNPATRKARQLPNLQSAMNMEPELIYKNHYGFCYDALKDDFKVYAIYNDFITCEYQVSVYSSKFDCWRLIGDFPFGYVSDYEPVIFANGALHWMVVKNSSDFEELQIISLDINTETYREILQPADLGIKDRYRLHSDIFGKSLSLLGKFEDHADFWVLKGCGLEEGWTKLFTIPYKDRLTMFYRIKPICITVNGDILLHFDSTMLLYNSKNNTFKDLLEINFFNFDRDRNEFCEADVYTYFESLVSP